MYQQLKSSFQGVKVRSLLCLLEMTEDLQVYKYAGHFFYNFI